MIQVENRRLKIYWVRESITVEITVYNSDEYVERSAALILECISEGNTVALSGGGTPGPIYKLLDGSLPTNLSLIQVDERFVPVDHERSNQRMIRRMMPISMKTMDFYPMITGDTDDMAIYVVSHERELRELLEESNIDLMILGMGADGHTASLFPNDETYIGSLKSEGYLVGTIMDNLPEPRISLSPYLIKKTKKKIMLITGVDKGETFAKGLNSQDINAYPFLVAIDNLIVIMDEACWKQYQEVIQ